MPTNKRRRTRGRGGGGNPPLSVRYFMYGKLDECQLTRAERWELLTLQTGTRSARTGLTAVELWQMQGERVLSAWIATKPGSRPFAWWEYDAPQPRQRLGGIGTTWSERLAAVLPSYHFGIPDAWLSQRMVDRYGGCKAIDRSDPPRF